MIADPWLFTRSLLMRSILCSSVWSGFTLSRPDKLDQKVLVREKAHLGKLKILRILKNSQLVTSYIYGEKGQKI